MSFFDKIELWDQKLLLLINGCNSEVLDVIMWIVTSKSFGIPVYVVFALVFYKIFGVKKALIFCALVIVAVSISDLTAKYCFKEVFERFRPTHHEILKGKLHIVNNYRGGKYGFISSHASNMFSFAVMVFLLIREKIRWLLLPLILWASLISYSRMYLGVHYPSDIIVGALVGSVIAGIVYYLAKQFNWIKC